MERRKAKNEKKGEGGFSLIEAVIALSVLLIALMGVLATITFTVNYNSGNSLRSQSLAILQQQMEVLQSAKFNPSVTDLILTGGIKTPTILQSSDGNKFQVQVIVDDDPLTAGVQTDASKTLKEISVTVTPENSFAGWQTSVATTTIIRRVRGS